MSQTLDLDSLGYALILLNEICQGYDSGNYRYRAINAIRASRVNVPNLSRWFSNLYPTTKLIKDIERVIENITPDQINSDK